MKKSNRQNARERRMNRRRWEHPGHIEVLARRKSYFAARCIAGAERKRGNRNTIYVPAANGTGWNVIRLDPWPDVQNWTPTQRSSLDWLKRQAIHHIDGNRHNNAIENLSVVTLPENAPC